IIDYKGLGSLRRIPFFDAVVMLTVLILTVTVDLMVAVGIGLLLACILFVKRMGDLLNIEVISLNEIEGGWVADDAWRSKLSRELKKKVLVFQLNGPLFFGAANNFLRSAERHGDFQILILRMHRVFEIDTTGAMAMEELAQLFKARGKTLFIAGLPGKPQQFLEKMKVLSNIGNDKIFMRFEQAANASADMLLQKYPS
ncbi:MAG: STAS domain-containing protein, partial [Candidatus Omnitrophica bacterium]|nr:STAS domain-containing protein [Candidatus Omnitrophota bacterium]